jgi:hypothetical protein
LDPRGELPSPPFFSLSLFLSLPFPSLRAPSFFSPACASPAAPRARPPVAPGARPLAPGGAAPGPLGAVALAPSRRGSPAPRRRGPPPAPPAAASTPCGAAPSPPPRCGPGGVAVLVHCARRPDPRRRGSLAPSRAAVPAPVRGPCPRQRGPPARFLRASWCGSRGLGAAYAAWRSPRLPNTFPRAHPHARSDLFLFF